MKKLLSALLVLVITFSSVAAMGVNASALTFTDSGTCNADNLPGTVNWTLTVDTKTDEMKLVFSGDGYMLNKSDYFPWLEKEVRWASFYGARLTEVVIEEGVKSIAQEAFAGEEALSKVTIPSTIEIIGDYAFAATALKSLTIPKATTNFSAKAMASCPNFTEYKVDAENTAYTAVDGMLLSKDGSVLVAYPSALVDKSKGNTYTAVKIPETVTTIGRFAFAGASVLSVTIPQNVKKLANMSFYSSSVEYVSIENGLEYIGDSVFLGCKLLKNIYIPDTVKYIGYLALGCVETVDTDAIISLLDDAGVKYTVNDDTDWEALVKENLPNYSFSDFTLFVADPDFTIYGKSGSAAENYASNIFPTPIKFTTDLCPAFLISVLGSKGVITLTWEKSTEAEGYYIYRRSGSGEWKTVATVSNVDSWIDASPESGVMNSYAVCAFNNNGENKAAFEASNDYYYLATPKLASVKNTGSGVVLTWGAVKGAEDYTVYRKLSGETSWTKLKTIDSSKTTFSDTNVSSGKLYTYTVRASKTFDVNEVDWSKTNIHSILGESFDYSRIFNEDFDYDAYYNGTIDMTKYLKDITLKCLSYYNTKGITSKFLSSPKLSGTVNEGSGVRVNWKAVSGASGYIVYRKAANAKSWTKIATVKGGRTVTYKDKSVKSGVSYTYTVRAYSDSYLSSYYSGVKTLFLSTPKLSSAKKTSTGIKVNYTKSVGATGYRIYRKTAGGSWQKIATVKGVSAISYLDKTAKKGVKYTYTVRAYNGSYSSSFYQNGISCKR